MSFQGLKPKDFQADLGSHSAFIRSVSEQPSQDVEMGTGCLQDVFNPVSQPPLVKTQTVTISDVSSAVKSEIPTKEVPIVHTETKTITYEAAQVRCVLINFPGA